MKPKPKEAFDKCLKVLDSCETFQHFAVAKQMIRNFELMFLGKNKKCSELVYSLWNFRELKYYQLEKKYSDEVPECK